MKRLLLILTFLLYFATVASATTYYVRSSGGNSTQCTGLANADYDGSGSGEACAFNHPFYFTGWWGDGSLGTPTGGNAGASAGGDDLIISCNDQADCTGVTFNTGFTSTWTNCNSGWAYGCFMRPIDDGTSGDHTTIKGCSSTGCATEADRPGFTGKGRNQLNINLKSSDWVDIEDVDVYDTGTCGTGHPGGLNCGASDSAEDSVRDNINFISASNISLKDMKVYGAFRYGLFGGGVNTITFDNVDINYNSYGGWDGDSCTGAGTCGMSGTITFQNGSEIKYNGCVMTSVYGTIAADGCYSQDQAGYGDGIGMGNTAGSWIFTDSEVSYNVSDGIDLLYINRGSYSGGDLTVKRSHFEGNAGQQIKGPNDMYVEDSVVLGNCGYHYNKSTTCDSGTCGASFNNCRAQGNTISINFKSGDTATPRFHNNTILSNGDVLFETSGTCVSGTDNFMSNNIIIGGRQWNDDTSHNGAGGNDKVSIYFDSASGTCNADFVETNNFCYDFKEGTNACNGTGSVDATAVPASFFSGTLLQGPETSPGYRTTEEYVDEVYLHASSPAINYSDETSTSLDDALDYNSYDRGASWDNGAIEYDSGAGEPDPCDLDCSSCSDEAACGISPLTCYWWSSSTCHNSVEPPPPAGIGCNMIGRVSTTGRVLFQ